MKRSEKKKELEKAGAKLPPNVVEREIKNEIIPWMERKEIIVITGARQTGKSVLLYQLIYDHLLPKTTNIYYFNLDVPHQLTFFDEADRLVDLINKTKGRVYLFIDEVQRLKEPGLFLKGLYDMQLPLKIVVSGSTTLEIRSKVQEALTGRKIVFHLDSFNLEELSCALFDKKKGSQAFKDDKKFKTALSHYLTYGSYPAVALAKGEKLKLRLLEEIFQSYLEKDIKSFLKIENEDAFRNLVKILSSQIGNLINKNELSNNLGIHKNTLDNYLFYLEQTFVVDFVRPFYKNPRKELLKNPKVYFRDIGLRNFAIGNFSNFEFRPDKGRIFENFSYLALKEKLKHLAQINFWRTKAGAEVDFVAVKGLKPLPFEVKASELKELKISKSLRSFLRTYHPNEAYCINLLLKGNCRIEDTNVSFLAPADLMKKELL